MELMLCNQGYVFQRSIEMEVKLTEILGQVASTPVRTTIPIPLSVCVISLSQTGFHGGQRVITWVIPINSCAICTMFTLNGTTNVAFSLRDIWSRLWMQIFNFCLRSNNVGCSRHLWLNPFCYIIIHPLHPHGETYQTKKLHRTNQTIHSKGPPSWLNP